MKKESYEGPLPNHRGGPTTGEAHPQAPREISIEEADNQVGRNNLPFNPGGEGHGSRRQRAGDPDTDCPCR